MSDTPTIPPPPRASSSPAPSPLERGWRRDGRFSAYQRLLRASHGALPVEKP